jgi:acyl carrier protein
MEGKAETADLRELILSTIANICRLDRETISLDSNVAQINLDSLSLLSVVTRIELAYGVEFLTEDTMDVFMATTVNDIVITVERMVESGRRL